MIRTARPWSWAHTARVKVLTYCILLDCMAEAWSRSDPTLLTMVYRATYTAAEV